MYSVNFPMPVGRVGVVGCRAAAHTVHFLALTSVYKTVGNSEEFSYILPKEGQPCQLMINRRQTDTNK